MKEELAHHQKLIKTVDGQIEALRKAEQVAAEGKTAEAISIAEKIMYEEGLLVKGVSWPLILANLYLTNNMTDNCWKYLDFITSKHPDMQEKISEIRVKILKKEGKHLDALYWKIQAILFKYSKVEFKPHRFAFLSTEEKVEKDLKPLIKKAAVVEKESEILSLVNKHLEDGSFDAKMLLAEFKTIIK